MVKSRHFCAVSALALLAAGAANAQDAARSAGRSGATVEELVVTGTFIAGTPEDAAIPVEALTLEELRQTGSPSNLDLVKSLSEVGSVAGEANRSNLFAVGAQSINLRSVSASRTVVVFNGRRIPEQFSSSVGRFNNVAIIPNAAIGRIETLKDGGGVTYGADAVGGVVNYITRRNLDGVETNANYRYIDGSDGDWDADISFGKVGERWNAMLVVGYQHRSELDTTDRAFALQPYLMNPSGWTTYGQPGSYLFQRAGQQGAITPSATAASGNRFSGDVQMGPTGVLRDPFCADLGGFAGFSATPSPVCYFQSGQITNLVEQQDTWQAYAEANYELNRYFRVHLEGLYYQLDVPHIPLDTFVAVPLVFPLTSTGSSQTIGGSAAYAVAGGNPAVRHLLLSTRNSNGTLAFGDPDTPGTQAYQIVNGGRVGLPSATWRPFGVGGAPIPELEQQHNTSVVLRGTVQFSGDLPEIWGAELKWSAAGTYNRIAYDLDFNDILATRMQAALNGLGGPNCSGTTPGANGCLYFNPFASAIARNVYSGQTNPGFVGSGSFAGYAPGQGLQNSPELVQWLYAPMWMRRTGEYSIYDAVLSGVTPIRLFAQDGVAFALGGQYRYYREESDLSDLADRALNPCATPGVTTCASASGPGLFSRGSGVSGLGFDYDRRYPVASAFFEVRAPLLDTLVANFAGRYEKFFSDISPTDTAVFVPSGSIRWQVQDWLAFRGTASESFSQVNPPARRAPTTTGNTAAPAQFGGTAVTFGTANFPNLEVKPERGVNYNVGAIVTLGGFRANVDYYSIKIKDISRAQTAAQLVNAIVQPGQTGPGALINCASPLLTEPQELLGGRPFVQLNGPCTAGSALNSPAGAGGLIGGTVNFFGQQGTQTFLVNGGQLKTSGIDVSASYRLQDLWGGDLTVTFDWTHILTYDASDYVVGGVVVAEGYSGLGTVNELTGRNSQRVFEDRASLGLNYRRGVHNLNVTTRFASSLINDDTADYLENGSTNANVGGANGVVPSGAACVDLPNSPPVPAGAGSGSRGANSGAVVGYCAGQNVTVLTGRKIPAAFVTDVSYQLALRENTTVTVTVQNLLDDDPNFTRDVLGYDAGVASPLGRTIRFGVRKRW